MDPRTPQLSALWIRLEWLRGFLSEREFHLSQIVSGLKSKSDWINSLSATGAGFVISFTADDVSLNPPALMESPHRKELISLGWPQFYCRTDSTFALNVCAGWTPGWLYYWSAGSLPSARANVFTQQICVDGRSGHTAWE